MNKCKINNTELDLRFKYNIEFKKRLSVQETYDSVVVQHQPFVLMDTEYVFEYPLADSTTRNLFLQLYQNTTEFIFTDYNQNEYNCIMVAYSEQKELGYYNLSGRIKVMGIEEVS